MKHSVSCVRESTLALDASLLGSSAAMILYKYLPPERLDLLTRRRIRFTQPLALNDPFEFRPYFETLIPDTYLVEQIAGKEIDIAPQIVAAYDELPEHVRSQMSLDALLEEMKQMVETENFQREAQDFLIGAFAAFASGVRRATPKLRELMIRTMGAKIGILSLTETPDSTLMWSHYGGQHHGFLVGFDSDHPFFDRRRSSEDEFYHLRRVQYQPPEAYDSLLDVDGDKLFLTKSPEWSYEREWRMLAPIEQASEIIQAGEPIALFEFPASSVVAIVLGARRTEQLATSVEDALGSEPQYAGVNLSQRLLWRVPVPYTSATDHGRVKLTANAAFKLDSCNSGSMTGE